MNQGSRIIELQTVAALAVYSDKKNDLFGQYNLEPLLTDPEAKQFYRAAIIAGDDNAVMIASHMKKSPEEVQKYLDLATLYNFDLDANIRALQEQKRELDADATLADLVEQRRLRKITRTQLRDKIITLADEPEEENTSVTSDNWQLKAPEAFAENGRLLESGHILTFPMQFRKLQQIIPFLRYQQIMSVIAQSGVGKTMLALMLVHWWALHHGIRVLYALAEGDWQTMVSRYVNRETGLPTDEIVMGKHNDAVKRVLKPYPSGGFVEFWECGGRTMPEIISKAREMQAKAVVIDTFHKISFTNYPYESRAEQVGAANADFVAFLQRESAFGLEILQMDKGNTASSDAPSVKKAISAIDFFQTSTYCLALDFKIATRTQMIDDPRPGYPGQWEYKDLPGVTGRIIVEKNRFGGNGHAEVFRDGSRSLIFEDPRRATAMGGGE